MFVGCNVEGQPPRRNPFLGWHQLTATQQAEYTTRARNLIWDKLEKNSRMLRHLGNTLYKNAPAIEMEEMALARLRHIR
ncbi:unnamed protein product, partial [Amoebophrya sp. A25]|eukprot:GSA25T00017431001.1